MYSSLQNIASITLEHNYFTNSLKGLYRGKEELGMSELLKTHNKWEQQLEGFLKENELIKDDDNEDEISELSVPEE